MCLIAHREVNDLNLTISNEIIDYNCWLNSDGFGLAWRERNGIRTKRYGPAEKEQFIDKLDALQKRNVELVVHWRMGTHGPKTRDYAHPFSYVDPQLGRVYVFHNGIIDILTEKNESDTQVFVRDVLAHLPSRWFDNPAVSWLVSESIGWSRLLIMTKDETIKIGTGWKWVDGIHYSTEPKKTYTSTTTYYGKDGIKTTTYSMDSYKSDGKSSSDAWKPSGKAMSNDEFRKYAEEYEDDDEEEQSLLRIARPRAADTRRATGRAPRREVARGRHGRPG